MCREKKRRSVSSTWLQTVTKPGSTDVEEALMRWDVRMNDRLCPILGNFSIFLCENDVFWCILALF